jgi:hypothetical protein
MRVLHLKRYKTKLLTVSVIITGVCNHYENTYYSVLFCFVLVKFDIFVSIASSMICVTRLLTFDMSIDTVSGAFWSSIKGTVSQIKLSKTYICFLLSNNEEKLLSELILWHCFMQSAFQRIKGKEGSH